MTELDDAIRSLREDVTGESPEAALTLERILQARRSRPSRTRIRLVGLLAAAFLFLGSLAWAAYTQLFREPAPGIRTAPADVPSSLPPTASMPSTAEPPTAPTSSALPVPSASASPSSDPPAAPSVGASSRATSDAASIELAAFEKGHRAQFDERDPARALGLWDDFLRRFPKSRWEPDVRYNRALCLIRLHRTEEARRALEPFARGYGGYRQREAVQLIEALNDAGP